MSNIELGTRVTFDRSDILRRLTVDLGGTGRPPGRYGKEWRKTKWGKRGDMLTGVIVGIRTLANGESQYNYGDEPVSWHPQTYFTAYLVAFDLRSSPKYLLPDDVEVLR